MPFQSYPFSSILQRLDKTSDFFGKVIGSVHLMANTEREIRNMEEIIPAADN
jgi:hypothetical protein